METKNYSKSEIFSLMNRIKKEEGVTQKEAYAMAKARLTASTSVTLADELIKRMQTGNVKFVFMNRGKRIVTTGTLRTHKIPTNRKVEGSRIRKTEDAVIFYDVRHGVYRQFNKNNVLEIVR